VKRREQVIRLARRLDIGLSRGYQTRAVGVLGQHFGVGIAGSDRAEVEAGNRPLPVRSRALVPGQPRGLKRQVAAFGQAGRAPGRVEVIRGRRVGVAGQFVHMGPGG